MTTLLDLADRISHNAACIHQAATSTISRPPHKTSGPFTEALLSNKPLTTFLRDAYPGEARLLSISRDPEDVSLMNTVTGAAAGTAGGDVVPGGRITPSEGAFPDVATLSRRQLVSATPLRRKNEVGPAGEGGDVFLKSALKLIDR